MFRTWAPGRRFSRPWRRVAGVVAVLASVGGGLGCAGERASGRNAGEKESADKFYQVAVGSFQNGMYSDAERQIDRALDIDEAHPDALYLKGLISLVEGKNMVIAMERESCLTDDAAELQRERAGELHRDSRDYFRRAAEAFGEDTSGRGRALNSMSVVSLYFGDYETAVREAEGALSEQFYASRFSALSNLGWAYFQQDKLVEAMAELREAVRMNPDHCVSRYRLAEVYFRYGMANESQALISGILEDADCPIQEAHALQGEILAVSGDISSSRVAYQACVEAAPRSCVARDCFERARVGVVASERNVTR